MTDYSKLYDEYLYDCYIANQHLTDEDWQYYGREEHHIEIPDRDGGLLTPLNSQPLTTYQHWVAGVLQSEVLGRLCFGFVPKEVLPPTIELLRIKWASSHMRRMLAAMTPEELLERNKKSNKAITPEKRKAAEKKRQSSMTPEQRSEASRKGRKKQLENTTPEELKEMGRRGREAQTPEQRSAAVSKGNRTRRLRRLGLI